MLHITEQKNPIPGRCLLPENNLFRETSRSIFERVRQVRAYARARGYRDLRSRISATIDDTESISFSIDVGLFFFFFFDRERRVGVPDFYRFFLLSFFLRFDRTFASFKSFFCKRLAVGRREKGKKIKIFTGENRR